MMILSSKTYIFISFYFLSLRSSKNVKKVAFIIKNISYMNIHLFMYMEVKRFANKITKPLSKSSGSNVPNSSFDVSPLTMHILHRQMAAPSPVQHAHSLRCIWRKGSVRRAFHIFSVRKSGVLGGKTRHNRAARRRGARVASRCWPEN